MSMNHLINKANPFWAMYAAVLVAWTAPPAALAQQQEQMQGLAQASASLASNEATESGGSSGAGREEVSRTARSAMASDEPAELSMEKGADARVAPSADAPLASEQSAAGN